MDSYLRRININNLKKNVRRFNFKNNIHEKGDKMLEFFQSL